MGETSDAAITAFFEAFAARFGDDAVWAKISAANADIGTMAYLTTPEVRGKAKTTPQMANTIGVAIWINGEMNGYRAEATNQMSKTLGGSPGPPPVRDGCSAPRPYGRTSSRRSARPTARGARPSRR